MERKKIVVIGGGFAGIAAVQKLLKSGVSAEIILVSKRDSFQYYPAIYKLVTGALAIEVAVPLRRIFHTSAVSIIQAEMVSADFRAQKITLSNDTVLSYDYAVLALGSETNYFNIPGLKERSFSFKSVEEALRLKEHFIGLFSETAGKTKEELVSMFHIMIVGGGPSGVELAGDLMSFLRGLAKKYGVDPGLITIDLIESSPRLLQAMPEKVSRKATRRLRMLGVNIFTNRAITSQEVESVIMKTMTIATHTVIWTAGTKIMGIYGTLPGITLTDRKRVKVDDTLSLPEFKNVYVVGDAADTPKTGLAQTAIHDGKYVGAQIAKQIKGQIGEPYKAPETAYVIPIGNYWAMFVFKGKVYSGFLPWLLRSVVDFRYFTGIVPFWYVLAVYRQGYKYRRIESKIKIVTQ